MTAVDAVALPVPVRALRWSGGFNELEGVAQEIGSRGIMFRVEYLRAGLNNPDGDEVITYPEIVLLDGRYQEYRARYNEWIVIGPGHRNVRVLDTKTYRKEYQSE